MLTFYNGRTAGKDVGALVFIRVDTPHGPIEVAVSFAPDRTVHGVIVTKATVETKPWVMEAIAAGLQECYRGLTENAMPAGETAVRGHTGELATYIAGEVDKGVARALVAYRYFYCVTT